MDQGQLDDAADLAWSARVAGLVADALVRAKLMAPAAVERATKIAAEEIYVRLALNDRPDGQNGDC